MLYAVTQTICIHGIRVLVRCAHRSHAYVYSSRVIAAEDVKTMVLGTVKNASIPFKYTVNSIWTNALYTALSCSYDSPASISRFRSCSWLLNFGASWRDCEGFLTKDNHVDFVGNAERSNVNSYGPLAFGLDLRCCR